MSLASSLMGVTAEGAWGSCVLLEVGRCLARPVEAGVSWGLNFLPTWSPALRPQETPS